MSFVKSSTQLPTPFPTQQVSPLCMPAVHNPFHSRYIRRAVLSEPWFQCCRCFSVITCGGGSCPNRLALDPPLHLKKLALKESVLSTLNYVSPFINTSRTKNILQCPSISLFFFNFIFQFKTSCMKVVFDLGCHLFSSPNAGKA